MHRRRRHRPVHPSSEWLRRAGCAGVLLGVVAVGVYRPRPAPTAGITSRQLCVVIDSFLAIATVGVSPPPDASPEDFRATTRVNAQLAQMSETLRQAVREMGC